ncbi:hypothetical protein ASC97_12450 [Rhizobium sp. Root1203]|uniref:hypothetical protein n=1 Tax=Rhizobium sp. Root1203 TaxID=1736427 RepID=UPI00070A20ED|nr:hypothetical protein [Rhizobium sp. Root1203]KQV14013.1 hypothetical protein ASC97_12450 [Rhizobium sp. Root1203]
MARTPTRSMVNLAAIGAGATIAYFVIVSVLAWAGNHWLATNENTQPVKTMVESTGLNSLGDFLSGFFAPATFLLVLVSTYIQGYLGERSGALAKVTANANYKFALHDKRLSVYRGLKEMSWELMRNGTFTGDDFPRLGILFAEGQFVFGVEVNDWLTQVKEQGDRLRLANWHRDTLNSRLSATGELSPIDVTRLDESIDTAIEIDQWMYLHLSEARIDEVMIPYLRLPANIDA